MSSPNHIRAWILSLGRGNTPTELAAATGMCRQTLDFWLRGTCTPKRATWAAFLAALRLEGEAAEAGWEAWTRALRGAA
jgi:DNA-binding phage protein